VGINVKEIFPSIAGLEVFLNPKWALPRARRTGIGLILASLKNVKELIRNDETKVEDARSDNPHTRR
jgi:hypothetical protein